MVDLNWNALYGFWLVAERGSYAEAARGLPRGSVQALHKKVRHLELKDSLSLKLFRSRGVKGVVLTAAGERLFRLLDPVFRDFDRLLTELRLEDRGPVHLAASAFVANNYLPALVARFAPRFPQVSIHVQVREPSEVVSAVQAGIADFGICSLTATPPQVQIHARAPMQVAIVAPAGHKVIRSRLRWASVIEHSLILPEKKSVIRQAFDALMRKEHAGRSINLRAEVTTPELAVHAVRAGMGIALLAMGPGLESGLKDLHIVAPPPGLPSFDLSVISRPNQYMPKYMRQFLADTTEVLQAFC